MPKYLTKEGLDNLKKELAHLEKEGRKEVAEKMKLAVSFGDISENAAYDDAREAQSALEGRISELKGIIASVKLIEKDKTLEVQMGSTVLLSCGGKKEKYCIVGTEEADILNGKISYQSPLGKILLGKKKGEKVTMKIPAGQINYEILGIE
jgi:transcription elongation factor GreA